MSKGPRIGIISYCDKVRTFAAANHQWYADKHGYVYIYDIAPTHEQVFKNKIEKILKFLDLFDYVFWIDDDAFFRQPDKPLDAFLKQAPKQDLIFCKSPVRSDGTWTYVSSGNFFIKNTPEARKFLERCLETPLDTAREHWNRDDWGIFTDGDQDIMTYLLRTDPTFKNKKFHAVLEYHEFNSRDFHFEHSSDEQFLIHFTGGDKNGQALAFAAKWNLSPALIPGEDFEQFAGVYAPPAPQPENNPAPKSKFSLLNLSSRRRG